MFRRKIIHVAIVLVLTFVLTTPAAIFAARPPEPKAPQAGAWELAWSLLSSLVFPGGVAARVQTGWENEGGAIDPNGTTTATSPAPLKPVSVKPNLSGF